MLRRTFCVSLVAIVISLVSIIVSIVTNKNFLTNDIKANAASSPYEVSFYPDEELFGFPWGTRWEVDGQKAYNASYEFSNKSDNDLYYKYVVRLIHDDSDRIATTSICYKVGAGKSDTKEFGEYFLSKKIEYNIKVYKTQDDCDANYPEFGKGAKVSYIAAEDDNGGFGFGLKTGQSSVGGPSFWSKILSAINSMWQKVLEVINSLGETKPTTPSSNTFVKNGYIRIVDKSGNYRAGYKQGSSSSACYCFASFFAYRIKDGSSPFDKNGPEKDCDSTKGYGSNHCLVTDAHKALNEVRDQILKGKPVIVNVTSSSKHWITVIGVKEASIDKANMEYADFLVADPLRDGEDNWKSLIESTRTTKNGKTVEYRKFRTQSASDGDSHCLKQYRIKY